MSMTSPTYETLELELRSLEREQRKLYLTDAELIRRLGVPGK
jgi:hypothetical protein